MARNNDVVIIDLDKPRELRFGHKAIKTLSAMGIDMTGGEEGNFGAEEMEKIIYCGILSDARRNGESLELSDMEDLLDQAESYQYIIEKMQEAFSAAFGGGSGGNGRNPAEDHQ